MGEQLPEIMEKLKSIHTTVYVVLIVLSGLVGALFGAWLAKRRDPNA